MNKPTKEQRTDNELIAEFMGLEWTAYEMLKYDYQRDWNALMPVIHKIGQIEDDELDYPINTTIQDAYNATVEYIKQYNAQKP